MFKRTLILLCIFAMCFVCTACGNNAQDTTSKETVVINYATDDTVNGYRVSSKNSDTMPDTIKGELVGAEGENNQYTIDNDLRGETDTSVSSAFCGNKNSKIFHKSTCGSVSKMKEENKAHFSNRAEYISNGYSPCKSCAP